MNKSKKLNLSILALLLALTGSAYAEEIHWDNSSAASGYAPFVNGPDDCVYGLIQTCRNMAPYRHAPRMLCGPDPEITTTCLPPFPNGKVQCTVRCTATCCGDRHF